MASDTTGPETSSSGPCRPASERGAQAPVASVTSVTSAAATLLAALCQKKAPLCAH